MGLLHFTNSLWAIFKPKVESRSRRLEYHIGEQKDAPTTLNVSIEDINSYQLVEL